MSPQDAIDDYLLDRSHLRKPTRDWYAQKLAAFAAWLVVEGVADVSQLTPPHLRRFAQHVRDTAINPQTKQPVSGYTLHGYAQVVKQFVRFCGREGYCDERLASKVTLPRVDVKPIATLSKRQVEGLLDAAKHEPTPQLVARDKALLALMLSTGVRAGEVCGLTLQNVKLDNPDDPHLVLQKTKSGKPREVGLSAVAVRYLRRYMRLREARRGVEAVFVTRSGAALTVGGLDQIWYRLRDWASGVDYTGVRVSSHTLRHTFAVTYMRQPDSDVFRLQTLLGHASPDTTSIYLRDYRQRDARRGPTPFDTLMGAR